MSRPPADASFARRPTCRSIVEEVGYPVIAKPDVGVGAAQTYRLVDDDDAAAFLAGRPRVDYIVEEELDGHAPHVRRARRSAGRDRLRLLARLQHPGPRRRPRRRPRLLDRPGDRARPRARSGHASSAPSASASGRSTSSCSGCPTAASSALEVNMRQPGGITVDLWNWANEFDFYRAWAEVVVRGTTEIRTERPYYCLWAGRKHGRAVPPLARRGDPAGRRAARPPRAGRRRLRLRDRQRGLRPPQPGADAAAGGGGRDPGGHGAPGPPAG